MKPLTLASFDLCAPLYLSNNEAFAFAIGSDFLWWIIDDGRIHNEWIEML